MPNLPIADKDTLDNVNSNVGAGSDAATAATLFGRIAQAYNHLTSYLSSTRMAKIDTIDTSVSTANTNINTANTRIGTSSDTASSSGTTLFALLKYVVARFTGYWTDARAAKLDTIDTLNQRVTTLVNANISGALSTIATIDVTTASTWHTVLNVSGAGYLTGVTIMGLGSAIPEGAIRIYVNGTQIGGDIRLQDKNSNSAVMYQSGNFPCFLRFSTSLRVDFSMGTYYTPTARISVAYMLI